jgi:hypothetical protein
MRTRMPPRRKSTTQRNVARLVRMIESRQRKLGGVFQAGRYSRPDLRDRFYDPSDAESLYADGLRAWESSRARKNGQAQEAFAYDHAKLQIEARFQNLKPGDQRVVTFADRYDETAEDEEAASVYDPATDETVHGTEDWDEGVEYVYTDEIEIMRDALLDQIEADKQRLREAEFEHVVLPRELSAPESEIWRQRAAYGLDQIASLEGVSLPAISQREKRVVQRAMRIWANTYPREIFPHRWIRRPRHDKYRVA